ncbi:SIR2 family protein [Aureimonas sp. D3]|uniref:SIR2 family protein n=1 Tax=Aureimonas sp. D3 TaxID=1638164 RepID=UPI0007839443|nr:SIR2 family protein [Aureimonas sp. D3]
MSFAPSATDITVREVLAKLDGEFATTAKAVENGEFALWVGSGISRKAPSLGILVAAAVEYIRVMATAPATADTYLPALDEALRIAGRTRADIELDLHRPFADWALRDVIINALWNSYSRVLDIPIPDEAADFILWKAIDIRAQFAHPAPPGAAHLCIAMLVLEGAVQTIASANWDGFIEAAVQRLGGNVPGLLQVVVDPGQLRDPPGRASLLKFHGCIIHADENEVRYRRFLTGSYAQILRWPYNPDFTAMRNTVRDVATNRKSLVLGLSIQDMNLQQVFTEATAITPWPWPPDPNAPAHVFCEETIAQGQIDVLRQVYGPSYNANIAEIHRASHMRAWGEQVLIALVLKMIADKLTSLMDAALAATGKDALIAPLTQSLNVLRDLVSDGAVVDADDQSRTPAVNQGIASWSRLLSVFRSGTLQRNSDAYEPISHSTINMLPADQNAHSAKLGHLAVTLALLDHGRSSGRWSLAMPSGNALVDGVATFQADRPGAPKRPVFLVKSLPEALRLQLDGAYANDNALIIHSDDIWHQTMPKRSRRSPSSAPGRTGLVEPSHVSIGDLLRTAANVDDLHGGFAAEVLL